jgi:biopolymer transport protein ExbD
VNFRMKIKPEPVGFQMTPMIDVVFLLLCFFVASQVFSQWEAEIDITLPTARTSESAAAPARRDHRQHRQVRRHHGERPHPGRAALAGMLKRLSELFPGQPVLLRADKATAYEHVIRVLDLCRQADIWNISFATGVPES